MKQRALTKTRRTFDRALQALPIMQHSRIWTLCVPLLRRVRAPCSKNVPPLLLALQPVVFLRDVVLSGACGKTIRPIGIAFTRSRAHPYSHANEFPRGTWSSPSRLECRSRRRRGCTAGSSSSTQRSARSAFLLSGHVLSHVVVVTAAAAAVAVVVVPALLHNCSGIPVLRRWLSLFLLEFARVRSPRR